MTPIEAISPSFESHRYCCALLKTVIEQAEFGIMHDNDFNEVRVLSTGAPTAECILTFCPFCGRRFEESTRGNQNAMTLLDIAIHLRTIEEITAVFGDAEYVCDRGPGEGKDPWLRAYYWWRNLPDLLLKVCLYSNDRIRRTVSIITPERRQFLEDRAKK